MKCWWIDVPLYVAAVSGLACGLVLAAGGDTMGIAAMAVAGVFLIAARYSSSDYQSSSDPEYDSESTLLQVLRQI
jgi:hypothetical protein